MYQEKCAGGAKLWDKKFIKRPTTVPPIYVSIFVPARSSPKRHLTGLCKAANYFEDRAQSLFCFMTGPVAL